MDGISYLYISGFGSALNREQKVPEKQPVRPETVKNETVAADGHSYQVGGVTYGLDGKALPKPEMK